MSVAPTGLMPMTVEALFGVLQNTFNPNPEERNRAEEQVKALKSVPGCLLLLLQIVITPQVTKELKQAAAIALKNIIKSSWEAGPNSTEPQELVSEQDKEATRGNLLEALMRETDKSVRDLLAECVKEISFIEFPDKWPALLPALVAQIRTGDPLRVHNSLLALRKLVKRYEYKPKDMRGPLNTILEQTFPLLEAMCRQLLEMNTLEAAQVLKLILKIFWSTTQYQLPALQDPKVMDISVWMDMFCAILAKPVENQPESTPERNAHPWWKVKKWCCQIVSRFFTRFGNPHYADEDVRPFAEMFSQQIAPKLLEQVMNLLALRARGEFCTDRVVHSCTLFVTSAIELSNTYKLLKPHMDFLLFQVVFPLLCLSKDDIELFESDPHEFIHKNNDPLEDFLDPKTTATTLLCDLAEHRAKDVLPKLLGFLTQILNSYVQTPPETRNYQQKEGALWALGSLAKLLKSKKKYSPALEPLLVQHVLPEFRSPLGYMRSRACWMMQHFADIKFTNAQNLMACLMAVLHAFRDPALPVQVEAANALRHLIEVEGTENALLPLLPGILDEYFRIMKQIGNDLVVQALEVVIDKFADHIGPHAVSLTGKLSDCFLQYAEEGDDDEAAMAAGQCIEALVTVLASSAKTPQLYAPMEVYLVPLISQVLAKDSQLTEYMENAIDLMTYLTFYGTSISPAMWTLYPLLFMAFETWAYDFVGNMAVPIDNYISKGGDVFLTGSTSEGISHMQLLLGFCRRVIGDEKQSEKEARTAASLLMSVLHHCQGRVDVQLPVMLEIAVGRLQTDAEAPKLAVSLLEVLLSAWHYDAQRTLHWTESHGATQALLTKVLEMAAAGHFESILARKLVCLGLGSLIAQPVASLPPSVGPLLPAMFTQIVKCLATVKEEEDKLADSDEEGEEEEDDEDEDDDDQAEGGYGEDQDIDDAGDSAYLDNLKTVDADEGGLGGWESEDEDEYVSPIDDLNILDFFLTTYQGAWQRDPAVYQQLQQSLPAEVQAQCQALLNAAAISQAEERAKQNGS